MIDDRDTSLLLMMHSKSEFRQEVINKIYDDFEKIITSLEQCIAELIADNKELAKDFTHSTYVDKYTELESPRTCEGCIWYDELHPSYCDCIDPCVRFKHGWDKDRYKQKDSE